MTEQELKKLFQEAVAEGWGIDGIKMREWLKAVDSLKHTTEHYEGFFADSYRCSDGCPACKLVKSIKRRG